jgi:hypothetical protein
VDPENFQGKYKAKAMVLGVFHFDYPELDGHATTQRVDVLTDSKQAEIEEVLALLAAYKPTKILLEFPRVKGDSIMNIRYQAYLNGDFDISEQRNEWYQLGFKLAKRLNHNHIYAVDANAQWCGAELDWDTYDGESYARERNQYDKAVRYTYEPFYELGDSLSVSLPLSKFLRYENNPTTRLKDHQAYLTETILEGAGAHYVGASSVSRWYQRNLKIFANAYDITSFEEEERLLLIFGSGHVWQLRQLFTDSPDYDYVEPNAYLKDS